MCRMFLNKDGTIQYNTTQWCCPKCKIPLYNVDRVQGLDNMACTRTCMAMHVDAQYEKTDPLYCDEGGDNTGKMFPTEHQVMWINVRRSMRKSGEQMAEV